MLSDKYNHATQTGKLSEVYSSGPSLLHFKDILDTVHLSMLLV